LTLSSNFIRICLSLHHPFNKVFTAVIEDWQVLAQQGGTTMGKIVECAKVDPSSGCTHVIRGTTEEEVLKKAAEHAKQHGIREVTPELKAKVKAAIRDEK
jgi:predicted small metal-binding protein